MATKQALPAKSRAKTPVAQPKPARRTRKNMSRGEILELQDHRMRRIWSVVLFAVGILFICLTLIAGEDGNLWSILHNALFALLSWGAFFIGPMLILISVLGVSDKAAIIISNKVWQVSILVFLICVAIEVCHPDTALQFAGAEALAKLTAEEQTRAGELQGVGIIEQIIQLAKDGMILEGGGLLSAIVAWPLMWLLGLSGAKITVFLALFVFAMLVTGLTVVDLFRAFSKPVKRIETRYRERRQLYERQQPSRASVDVPLGPDDMPQHPVQSPREQEDEGLFRRTRKEPNAERVRTAKDKLFGKAPAAPAGTDTPGTPVQTTFEQPQPGYDARQSAAFGQPVGGHSVSTAAAAAVVSQIAAPAESGARQESRYAPAAYAGEKPDPGTVEERMAFDSIINNAAAAQNAKKNAEPVAPIYVPATDRPVESAYVSPTLDLLDRSAEVNEQDVTEELRQNAARLVETLASFGVQTRIVDISRGPSVTRYELQPQAGVKIARITSLADDITLNLATAGVRIEAPIPNKAAVGIEVPNKIVSIVHIIEMLRSPSFCTARGRLTVALGKDIEGKVVLADVAKMPHVLIAGATGSGKSVCINSFIVSLLYKATPDEVRLLLIDPKVVELGVYNGIPHLLIPVVTDPRKAAGALAWAVNEMLNRYKLFAENSVRDLSGYNELAKMRTDLKLNPMPQIVIVIDELADLMMAAPNDVESSICRLAQMARAAGMHLIIATQRPSVDVITGIIKANIPSRIAFGVASQVDSRTILDQGGAEKLLGRGDMLFYPVGANKPSRLQGCYVSDHEVERVVTYIKSQGKVDYDQQVIDDIERQAIPEKPEKNEEEAGADDELLMDAIECVIDAGQASTSLLQRKLKVGYARAGRLVDDMETRGIVGPFEGSKPRLVLMTRQQFQEMTMRQ